MGYFFVIVYLEDVKRNSVFVTFSFCYFYFELKTMFRSRLSTLHLMLLRVHMWLLEVLLRAADAKRRRGDGGL